MATRDTLDQLARQIGSLFGQADLPQDIERNLRALMQAALAKMDLVTRDEFDAQAAVLARTRAKLDQLEVQLIDLAKQLETTDPH
jgi:ubiquinone biosynthesis accessory factor UbiK